MNDDAKQPKRRHFFRSLLLFLLLLLVAAGGIAYALGWVSIQQGEGKITIEIQTGKVKKDTDQAVEKGKGATVETGKAIQKAGKNLEDLGGEGSDQPTDSKPPDEPTDKENDQ